LNYIKAFLFLAIFFISGCDDYDSIVDSEAKSAIKLKTYPKSDTLILFTDESTIISSMKRIDAISIETIRKELKNKLNDNIAFTSGREVGEDSICPIIINSKKAFKKYGQENIKLLINHEIGHCYQNLLNEACDSNSHDACALQKRGNTKQANSDLKYEEYVKESFADFIGIYKLSLKLKDDRYFDLKKKINNQAYKGGQPDYRKSHKALELASQLYLKNIDKNFSKRQSDLELTKAFYSGICGKVDFLENKCITKQLSTD